MKKREYFFILMGLLFLLFIILFLNNINARELCDVNSGSWSSWSSWSNCSKGLQSRSRIESKGCIDIDEKNCSSEYSQNLVTQCVNTCSSKGEVLGVCNDNTVVKIECGDYNNDGCLGWSDNLYEYCGKGMYCQRGVCTGELCDDKCSFLGEQKVCVNNTAYKTKKCDIDNSGCYDWGNWEDVSCNEGETCKEGACTGGVETWVCKEWSYCKNGIQKRKCIDVKQSGSEKRKPTEIQSCISDIKIDYNPKELNLIVPEKYNNEFVLNIFDNRKNREVSVKWFFNSDLKKTDKFFGNSSGVLSIFSKNFKKSGILKAEVSDLGRETEKKEIIWNVELNKTAKKDCFPYWKCGWSDCSSGELKSYSYDCVDLNFCGVNINMPYEKKCDCYPEWECSGWSECTVKYGLKDIFENKKQINLRGYKENSCVDLTGCKKEKIQRTLCNISTSVSINKSTWCSQTYVEILDINTNEVVGRVKKTGILEFKNISRIDISFSESNSKKYCDYCFNNIKDYDETEVDCGGTSCPSCLKLKSFFNWIVYLNWFLWSSFSILFFIIIFTNIENFKKIYRYFFNLENNIENKLTMFFKNKI